MVPHFARVECAKMHTPDRSCTILQTLQITISTISNKDAPMRGLNELHDISPS